MRMWRRSFAVSSGAVTFFSLLQELSKGELVPAGASSLQFRIQRSVAISSCEAVRPLFGLGALDEAFRSGLGNVADELRLHSRGREVVKIMRRNGFRSPIIMLTGQASDAHGPHPACPSPQ